MENLDDRDMTLYYQINYTLTDVPGDAACFHAQFRRVHKLPFKTVYTILDGVQGQGQMSALISPGRCTAPAGG